MQTHGPEVNATTLRCPQCHSALKPAPGSSDDVDRLCCEGCGRDWPVRFGIPDLRANGVVDPYLTIDEDIRAAGRLFERADRGGFEDALAAYYETNARVSPAQARRFIAGTLAAEERSRAVLSAWIGPGGLSGDLTFVDAGCGTGPLLVAAYRPAVRLVGIDVGLRWLVLAAARLRERGVPAELACAGAEQLPLPARSVDILGSESLLENVPSASAALGDAARVLRDGGILCLTTANRRSLGPDPHVGLPMGGWLPDRVVGAWATRHGMVPPSRHLLTAGELKSLLAAASFTGVRIAPPPVVEAQVRNAPAPLRAAVAAYGTLARLAPGRAFLTAFGPLLLAVARRAPAGQALPRPGA